MAEVAAPIENLLEKELDNLDIGEKDVQEKELNTSGKGDGKPKFSSRRFRRRDPRTEEERYREWSEKQKNKEIVDTKLNGTVKWFSLRGHYGFIERSDGKGDIFVHQSAITKSHIEKRFLRSLAEDQNVEFDLVKGEKGLEAANVCGPDGTAVKEIKLFRYPYRPRNKTYQRRRNSKRENEEKSVESKGDGESNGQEGKPEKTRRARNYRRKPKNSGEKSDGDEKVKHDRRRRRDKSATSDSPKDTDKDVDDCIKEASQT